MFPAADQLGRGIERFQVGVDGTGLYGVLAFLIFRELRRAWQKAALVAVAVCLAVLIGVPRVYLGVHWPSDVLASWLVGAAWLALLCGAYVSWERAAYERAGQQR